VTFRAYEKLLQEDILTTGYDTQYAIKQIILDVLEHLIESFSPYGAWDARHVLMLCRVTRPRTTAIEAYKIACIVRYTLCEELAIPPKGYRMYVRFQGEFIRYIPIKVDGYDDYTAAHA
jgi:hypothetical protein